MRGRTVALQLSAYIDVKARSLFLRVDHLDAFAQRCSDAGLQIEWDTRYPGVRRFYVDDPFGNRLELLQPG